VLCAGSFRRDGGIRHHVPHDPPSATSRQLIDRDTAGWRGFAVHSGGIRFVGAFAVTVLTVMFVAQLQLAATWRLGGLELALSTVWIKGAEKLDLIKIEEDGGEAFHQSSRSRTSWMTASEVARKSFCSSSVIAHPR
jgi:hypothetical protein